MSETLSCIELAPDDLAELPARLRKRIGAAIGSADVPSGDWLLVGTADAALAQVIERALEALPSTAAKRNTRLTEADIEKLLDVMRAASGLKPRNRSEPASRWKREGRLFAVRRAGVDLYPSFQFADGAPLPVIKDVLAALPGHMTGWQIALWFGSGNGWLDGAEPHERLSDPDAVVDAARKLADSAVG